MATIKAGTYVFKQTITNPTSNINVANFTEVKGYCLTANNTYVSAPEDITNWNLTPNGCSFSVGQKPNNMNNWTTSFYDFSSSSVVTYTADDTKLLRTIIVTADQTNVSEAFYNWFTTNIETTPSTKLIKIKFKDTITYGSLEEPLGISISFTSNGTSFTFFEIDPLSSRLMYGSTVSYKTSGGYTNPNYQYIEIDPTQPNFNAFITAMKSNIDGVELEAGTYKWGINDVSSNINSSFGLNFVSNSTNYTNLNITNELKFLISYVNSSGSIIAYNTGTWNNNNYKTIVVETAQYVPYDFYNYAILGNQLVKQTTPSSGETWVLNESLGMGTLSKTSVTFTSNNENFVSIAYSTSSMGPQTLWYYKNDTEYVVACEYGTYSNQAYRTITFETAPTGDLLTWLQANATKQGSTPTYKFKHWKKSNVVVNRTLVGGKYYYFKPYTILGLYTITTTLTNCTGASANATNIQENGGLTLTFTANSGYELPTGVSVTNVTSYNWNKSTGVLAISKPTGDVTIEIVAVSALPQLSTPTNVAVTDTTLTFDEVANATSYEVFVDNVSIGTYVAKVTHTLTFESDITTQVNGTSVTSPYTFNEGDTITLTTPSSK